MKKNLLLLAVVFTTATFPGVQASAQEWHLTGNSDATATSKLGTINSQPVRIYVKDAERMRVDSLGRVAIGTPSPMSILTVKASGGNPVANWVNGGRPLFVGFGESAIGNADMIFSIAS